MTKSLFHLRQFRLLLLVLLCALFSLPLSAQEAYVVQSGETTLTFYYDNNRDSRSGKTWGIDEKKKKYKNSDYIEEVPAWAGTYNSPTNVVTKVTFDASFKDFRPTITNYWFYNLKNLTTIEGLENLNTSAVTDMSYMFSKCSSLTSLNLSNFNTSAVTNMGQMFYGCSSLTSLNVSNFNTSAVTNMSEMFYGCSSLKSLNLSNFNTSKVTNMNGMFFGCSSLTELNLSNFNTAGVIDMRWMFENCSSLKTIFNTQTWRCGQSWDMFKGCTQLRGAVKYDASKVDVTMANPEIGYFRDPTPKAYVQQSEDKQTLTFYYDINRILRSGKNWYIDDLSAGSEPAWAGTDESPNNVVTKVVFDVSFKDFRPTTTLGWFYHLSALTTIEGLENLNTSAVTDMRSMFSGCSSLKELNVSNFNTSKVTDMSEMFSGCSGLKTILNTNTWRCEKSQDMFKGCTQLNGAVKFDDKKLDVTMANPETGYFSIPSPKAYVRQSEDKHTLTFFYDAHQTLRSGKTWDIYEKSSSSKPVWAGTYEHPNGVVTKVVFDDSFKNYRPITTKSWFANLRNLTTIEGLENLNTSAVTDMSEMVSGCSGLKEINVSNFNTSKVTDMYEMFRDCSSLKELNISNFNTSAVTDMSEMFDGCSSLKELNVSNFNTSKVTDMSKMFSYCSSLRELNVSNFNTAKVTNMSGMFAVCSGLTELNVSNFNTSAVTNMWGMFSSCSRLTSLNLSNFNTSAVTNMVRMFSYCSGLKTIINTNTWRCERSFHMFYDCTQLNGAVKYGANKVDATMANPTTGYFTDPNREYPKAYVLQSEDQHTLTFYYDNNRILRSGKTWDIDEKSSSSKPVWAGTYSTFNKAVKKVVFDASFKDFRPTTTEGWFYNLSALTTIEGLENLNTSKVTNMSDMFSGCSSLTELNVSNFNTSAVTNMDGMFEGCSGLTELNVSNFNTSAVTNMNGMFFGCSSLKELNVSNFSTSAVTNMRGMFYVCSRLSELNVSNFNTSNVTNMEGMFYGCSRLTELNVSNFSTYKVTNMEGMFENCFGLKTIFDTNTWRCEQSLDMFKGCTQLKGAVKYDESKVDATMANPTTGYFTNPNKKLEAYVLQSEDPHTLILYYDNNRKLRSGKTWDIDKKLSHSRYVWDGIFGNPSNVVTKVVFDASFKDFRPTTTEGWFYDLSELTTIEGLENLNTSAVKDMSMMFYGCSGLKELNLSNFNTSAVTDMSQMFYNCSSLTELNLSNFNTAGVIDMKWMFLGCSGLKTILNTNTWRCEKSQDMFKGCTQLKGAVKYDESKLDVTMANFETGYFSQKLPTAIGRVVFDDNNATQIYNLQGKRVNANQRHLPAGFYIVNGKKVYLNEKP